MIKKLYQVSSFINSRLKDLTEGPSSASVCCDKNDGDQTGQIGVQKEELATTLLDQPKKPLNQANQKQIWSRIKLTNDSQRKFEEYFFQGKNRFETTKIRMAKLFKVSEFIYFNINFKNLDCYDLHV